MFNQGNGDEYGTWADIFQKLALLRDSTSLSVLGVICGVKHSYPSSSSIKLGKRKKEEEEKEEGELKSAV